MPAEIIYYVYSYIREDGTPYYIGMGKDRRAYVKHKVEVPPRNRIVFVEKNLTLTGAFAIERRLIAWYGRKRFDKDGILENIEPGGCGHRDADEQSLVALKMVEEGRHPWKTAKHKQRVSDWHIQRKETGNHHLVKAIPVVNSCGVRGMLSVEKYNSQTGPKDSWEYVHTRSYEAKRRKELFGT